MGRPEYHELLMLSFVQVIYKVLFGACAELDSLMAGSCFLEACPGRTHRKL
jgi:hypothetical protein